MAATSYLTLQSLSEGLYKEKGSKFMAFAIPVEGEGDISEWLSKLRKEHPGAVHVCYAWRLGAEMTQYRANDDGEPSGTAGLPILGEIRSSELTNVLVAVVRYYGGTKLGTSGLVEAYKTSVRQAIREGNIIEKKVGRMIGFSFPPEKQPAVMSLVKSQNANILESEFGLTFQLVCSVDLEVFDSFHSNLERLGCEISNQ